jgi:enoyl-[acyl-carrier protein] reductase III
MREFKNKNQWALILGGSSGLGLATARKLAVHGMNIIVVHRSSRAQTERVDKDFQKIKDMGVEFQQYNQDAVNDHKREVLIQKIEGELDKGAKIKALVHSVAKGNLKPMTSKDGLSLRNDDFELTINAMGISLYNWTKSLFERHLLDADARIISFTSEGSTKAWENYAAVSAAKSTLESITRSIALEFAPFGIKANCIQAGVTDTASLRMIPGSDEIIEHSIKRNPNKRLTTPEDVANVVYLLCKDEASWITGSVIQVDGGEHLR